MAYWDRDATQLKRVGLTGGAPVVKHLWRELDVRSHSVTGIAMQDGEALVLNLLARIGDLSVPLRLWRGTASGDSP